MENGLATSHSEQTNSFLSGSQLPVARGSRHPLGTANSGANRPQRPDLWARVGAGLLGPSPGMDHGHDEIVGRAGQDVAQGDEYVGVEALGVFVTSR